MVSVIIATRNRSESLRETLESFCKQKNINQIEHEVIVVDNNSYDDTNKIVDLYRSKLKIRYILEINQGKSYALNRGIKESNGQIIAFTDDDVILDNAWLFNIVQCFDKMGCDGMGGRVLPLYTYNTPKWIMSNKDLLRGPIVMYDYGNDIKQHDNTMAPFIGANMAFKRECFDLVDGFKTDIGPGKGGVGEDSYFFRELELKDSRLYYCGTALVWHKIEQNRMNYNYIIKWHINSGRYFVRKKNILQEYIYYFGVPRFLYKQLILNTSLTIINCCNRRLFLKYLLRFSTNLGEFLEYKTNYAKGKCCNPNL